MILPVLVGNILTINLSSIIQAKSLLEIQASPRFAQPGLSPIASNQSSQQQKEQACDEPSLEN